MEENFDEKCERILTERIMRCKNKMEIEKLADALLGIHNNSRFRTYKEVMECKNQKEMDKLVNWVRWI